MEGWRLDKGEIQDNNEVNLLSIICHSLFSTQAKTTTYKYCFFKCILDNLFLCDNEYKISLDSLNVTFATIYWNSTVKYHIPSANNKNPEFKTSIEMAYEDIVTSYPYTNEIEFDSLNDDIKRLIIRKTYSIFIKNVVGALYSDMEGMLYGFDKKNKYIILNEKSFNTLSKNKVLLDQLNYYEWLKIVEKILDKRNNKIENLSTKLECITKRTNLDFFKDQLIKKGNEPICFYCETKITNNITLDHVIPFDFIRKDELWNLVFCHKNCNSSKNDKVPKKEYIDKLIKRNKELGIDSPNIEKIYQIAIENGVEIWNK